MGHPSVWPAYLGKQSSHCAVLSIVPCFSFTFFHWKAWHAFYLSDLLINIQNEMILWIMSLLRYSCSYACIVWCTSTSLLAFLLHSLFLFKPKLSRSRLSRSNAQANLHIQTSALFLTHPFMVFTKPENGPVNGSERRKDNIAQSDRNRREPWRQGHKNKLFMIQSSC